MNIIEYVYMPFEYPGYLLYPSFYNIQEDTHISVYMSNNSIQDI